MLTGAQTRWQVLPRELCARLHATRRRKRVLGCIPAVCCTVHNGVARMAACATAEEKHSRCAADIESDTPRLKNLAGKSAVLGDVLSRSPVGAEEAMEAAERRHDNGQ